MSSLMSKRVVVNHMVSFKTTTPEQVQKMLKHHVLVQNEIIHVRQVFDSKGPKGIVETKASKEALTLRLSPLLITLDMENTLLPFTRL